jgi:hypothetical protein
MSRCKGSPFTRGSTAFPSRAAVRKKERRQGTGVIQRRLVRGAHSNEKRRRAGAGGACRREGRPWISRRLMGLRASCCTKCSPVTEFEIAARRKKRFNSISDNRLGEEVRCFMSHKLQGRPWLSHGHHAGHDLSDLRQCVLTSVYRQCLRRWF